MAKLFAILRRLNLTPNFDECLICVSTVPFVGYELSPLGFSIAPQHISAILSALRPRSKSQVRAFLGLINMARRFIPHAATLAEPLSNLLRKNSSFDWQAPQEQAFNSIKQLLADAPSLGFVRPGVQIELYTDASCVGVGAVAFQFGRPVAYSSRVLTDTERRYHTRDQEALALVYGLVSLRDLIICCPIRIMTDHRNLQWMASSDSRRIIHWLELISEFDFEISYVKGAENPADWLSRLAYDCSDVFGAFAIVSEAVHYRLQPPTSWADIESAQQADQDFVRQFGAMLKHDGVFVTRDQDDVLVPIIPPSLRQTYIRTAHQATHFGVLKTQKLLLTIAWWPSLRADVKQYVSTCDFCIAHKSHSAVTPNPTPIITSQPLERIQIDFKGPINDDNSPHKYFVLIVDHFSGFSFAQWTDSPDSASAIRALSSFSSLFGRALTLQSDNGSHFTSAEFKSSSSDYVDTHVFSSFYNPQAQGSVESRNKLLMQQLEFNGWDLDAALHVLNFSPAARFSASPAQIMFRVARPRLSPSTLQTVSDPILDRHFQEMLQAKSSDLALSQSMSPFEAGDLVVKRTPQSDEYTGPFEIIQCGSHQAQIKGVDGKINKSHVRYLKKVGKKPARESTDHEDSSADSDADSDPDAPIVDASDSKEEAQVYEVQELTSFRFRNGTLEFRVKWKGYTQQTWTRAEDISDEVIHEYLKLLKR